MSEKITIIGTGNVAYHLGKRFKEKGFQLNEIIGRNTEKTTWLSEILQTDFTLNINKIKLNSDIYIVAVSDNAIEDIAKKIAKKIDNQLIVHTSGSIPSSIFKPYFKHYGSLYPLQTFSINSQPNFEDIPIFYNATPPQYFEPFLEKIAKKIANKTFPLPDEKRVILHIAAVFVNNFTNYLYTIGAEIVQKENLPFDVLKPLIEETVRKIEHNSPKMMQTGPAKRRDTETIDKHLEYLKNNTPQYLELYTLFTKLITSSL